MVTIEYIEPLVENLMFDVGLDVLEEDFENFWSECPWDDDLQYAKAVCDQVDVPLEVVHLTDEYWNNVSSSTLASFEDASSSGTVVYCGHHDDPDSPGTPKCQGFHASRTEERKR